MDIKQRVSTYLIIAVAFGFSIYFFASPFLYPSDQSGTIPSLNQSPDSISTLASDIDACMSNPTSDCDQEMMQINKYCNDNKGQDIPICSDARVKEYVGNRGLERPPINTGR
jgi:hypothetical protein